MKKKLYLSISAFTVLTAPIAIMVSCGKSAPKEKPQDEDVVKPPRETSFGNDIIHSTEGSTPDISWGKENFANEQFTFIENRNKQEYQERQKTGQPFTLHFHPADMAQWKAGKDADDAFNKATIPLQNREFAYKILASQMDNDLDILTGLNGATSKTTQGTVGISDSDSRLFSMWSNISTITSWGGSTSEGLFVIPKGSDINAAHKNGVPIIATFFCPPEAFGGSYEIYEELVAKKDGKYIVADKMIEMARYYGFDGWFLNWEAVQGISDALKTELGKFQEYIFNRSKEDPNNELYIQLYDYGMGQHYYSHNKFDIGSVDYQYRNKLETHGADESKISYGYNYGNGDLASKDEGGVWNISDPNAPNFVGDKNAWIYTYLSKINPTQGDEKDLQFFSSSEGDRDPRIHGDDAWFELGKVFNQRTTIIGRHNFSTAFQMGFGKKWFTNGVEQQLGTTISEEGWKNGGVQSILPTWKYIIDAYNNTDTSYTSAINRNGDKVTTYTVAGSTFKATIDDDGTAYNGSTKLHYTGKIAAGQTVVNRMFASDVQLATGDTFEYIIQGSDNHPKMTIWLGDNPEKPVLISSATPAQQLGNDYHKVTFTVPAEYANKKMISFGLAYENNKTSTLEIDSRISQLDFKVDSAAPATNELKSIKDEGDFTFMGQRNVRINWEMQDNSQIDHYVIYGTKSPTQHNKDYVLSVSSVPAAYLTDVEKFRDLPITIVAYDKYNNVVSDNPVVILTSFVPMNDASKWSVKWEDQDGEDANWKFRTGNGYTTSFQTNDGTVFFGDDKARLHVVRNGKLESNRTEKWGEPILAENDGVKILNISQHDENHILVLTSSGTTHLINSKTGESKQNFVTTSVQTHVKQYLKTSGPTYGVSVTENKKLVSNISLVKKIGDKTLIFGEMGGGQNGNLKQETGGLGFAITLSVDGTIQAITIQEGIVFEDFVEVDAMNYKAIARSCGNYDANRKVQLVDVQITAEGNVSIPTIDWSKDLVSDIVTSLDGAFKTAYDATGYSSDASRIMARGEIVFSQKIGDKFLFVNSMGAMFVVNSDGTLNNAASILSVEEWKALADSVKLLNGRPGFNISGFNIGDVLDVLNILDRDRLINKMTFIYDEINQTLTYAHIAQVPYAWWGFAHRARDVVTVEIESLINGTLTTGYLTPKSKINLPTENYKKLEGIVFMHKVGNVYIVGTRNESIGLLDSNFVQKAFGKKVYSYNGEVQFSIEYIYNDGNLTTPPEFIN